MTTAAGIPKPIPDTYRRVTPTLIVRGGAKGIEFYAEVFEATERMRFPGPDDTTAGTNAASHSPGPRPPTKSCPTPPAVKEFQSRDTRSFSQLLGACGMILRTPSWVP
jgi:hypothetical protein